MPSNQNQSACIKNIRTTVDQTKAAVELLKPIPGELIDTVQQETVQTIDSSKHQEWQISKVPSVFSKVCLS